MRVGVGFGDLRLALNGIEGDIARVAGEAMRETTPIAKQDLREQVTGAGLGTRLANTWRSEVYPKSKPSLSPSGYIWSNAPDIVDSFNRGATIRPFGSAKYLWIPTKNVPRARGRVNRRGQNVKGGAMSPEDVENQFNTDFVIRRGRNGTLLAFIDVVKSLNGKTYRRSTKGRARQGRFAKPVLMFVLRRTVRLPRLLNIEAAADQWADRFSAAFSQGLGTL
jgi:hypothetical protein